MKRLTPVILGLVLVTACGNSQPRQAYDALSALRKLQAATEVGVSYAQYHSLLIEAQTQVNNAETALSDGPLKTDLRLAMDSYIDAGTVWQEKMKDPNYFYLRSDTEPGKSLMKKYTLATVKMENGLGANADKALHAIWFHANLRLEKLKDLLPSK